jgi:GNAT superfamily N-acetyltransferase
MKRSTEAPHLRTLTLADLNEVLQLQQLAIAGLPAGFVRPRSAPDLAGFLEGRLGAAVGILERDALVAMSLLILPDGKTPTESLDAEIEKRGVSIAAGLRARLSEEDWGFSTCFLANALVHPAARGRGYQRLMIAARLKHAAAARMKWAFAGVHLENAASWRNLLAHEMAAVMVSPDPRHPLIGLLRGFGSAALATDARASISVCAADAAQHQAALQRGYIGTHLGPDGAVIYRKLVSAASAVPAPRQNAHAITSARLARSA